MSAILEVKNVSVNFGGLAALSQVSLKVPRNKIAALIGPNGAGKTTCFNVISGLQVPDTGAVIFAGKDISDEPADRRSGMGRTFQVIQLFEGLTVRESIMLGAHRMGVGGFFSNGILTPKSRQANRLIFDKADQIIERLELGKWRNRYAVDLPLGLQRIVELGRALATDPDLLMLDESASGLSPSELARLENLIRAFIAQGLSILLVEHNMRFVSRLADHLIVLNFGQVIFEGDTKLGLADPQVISAYLGGTTIDA
jgi:ABC-type branched-subunit amino acid transport system ATPase component